MAAPLIAVLCNHTDGEGPFAEKQVVNQAYLDGLERAGGVPLLVPDADENTILALLEVAGVLVTGGADFDPRSYGRQPHRSWAASIRAATTSTTSPSNTPWPARNCRCWASAGHSGAQRGCRDSGAGRPSQVEGTEHAQNAPGPCPPTT